MTLVKSLWKKLLSKSTLWKIVGLLIITYLIHSIGVHDGRKDVQEKWDLETTARNEAISLLKIDNARLETENILLTQTFRDGLQTAKDNYEENIRTITAEYDSRLHNARTREAIYQRKSQSGEVERRHLADHTAKLDRQLEEGITLVDELSELVKLRDRQLTLVGEKLLTDHKLLQHYE